MLTQVLALGFTQTVAWASSTYLIAILAAPVARDLGLATSTVFGAFSVALVVMGLAGPAAGRAIDTYGGRGVLALSNLVLAVGLAMLAFAYGAAMLFAAWCVLGLGMALGLYEAAFAALVRIHGAAARAPITGITLIAGFASTVGWPVTALLSDRFGWRAACLAWAVTHIVLALPLNLACIPRAAQRVPEPTGGEATSAPEGRDRTWHNYWRAFFLLAAFGALTSYVTSAMAAHLPGLLLAVGTTSVAALTASALLGPAQVAARLTEFLAARRFRFHPLLTARIATALHPIGGIVLALFGGPAQIASAFAMLHGAGNGMITIAKGTLPLAIFGAAGYGHRQGLLSFVGRGMQAIAPFTFGLVLEQLGARAALSLSVVLSLAALAALLALRERAAAN
ncbi:MAG TPA: MFS transporter [Burkholderiales bacterium]|nr:MFS transporter [Burkholderiales bacterium]